MTAPIPASLNLRHGHAVIQLGDYWSAQGETQHINIEDLIGDGFTVSHQYSNNGLVGLGIKLNQVFGEAPLKCGYHFFYLGQDKFNVLSTKS